MPRLKKAASTKTAKKKSAKKPVKKLDQLTFTLTDTGDAVELVVNGDMDFHKLETLVWFFMTNESSKVRAAFWAACVLHSKKPK